MYRPLLQRGYESRPALDSLRDRLRCGLFDYHGVCPQGSELRRNVHLQFVVGAQRQHARQRYGARPTCGLHFVARAVLLHPSPQEAATFVVEHCLGSVIRSVIEESFSLRVKLERLSVERADLPIRNVFSVVYKHTPFTEREEVRTLPHLAASDRIGE